MTEEDNISNDNPQEAEAGTPVAQPGKTTSFSDIGLTEKDSVGFTTDPSTLNDLIAMITLPKSKAIEFPKIVLNFDPENQIVWWANSIPNISNFGFFDYKYVNACWGSGSVGLPSTKLIDYAKELRGYSEATFWAHLKTKIFGMQSASIDKFSDMTCEVPDIKTALAKIPVNWDSQFIPIVKDKARQYIYGADVETSELALLVERASRFSTNSYPFKLSADSISVTFNDYFNPKDNGANAKQIVPKPGSFSPPDSDIVHIVNQVLEGPAKVLRGIVTMRFAGAPKSPLYILKKETNKFGGQLVAGFVVGTNEKTVK